jgi:hypothetical protein
VAAAEDPPQYDPLRESLRGGFDVDRQVIDKLRQEVWSWSRSQTIYRAQLKQLQIETWNRPPAPAGHRRENRNSI